MSMALTHWMSHGSPEKKTLLSSSELPRSATTERCPSARGSRARASASSARGRRAILLGQNDSLGAINRSGFHMSLL
eukprot:scaffold26543_cov30-Tisochrysis_lutea.AAC.1